MTEVAIATEDELSEIVCKRLVAEAGMAPFLVLRKGGNGYLRSRISSFCQMAQSYPVIVLTDQDMASCAPGLVAEWLRNMIVPENLMLRVAVHEIESWLLADKEAVRAYFGVNVRTIAIEEVGDPKQFLLEALRRSNRAVRESVVEVRRGHAFCGVGYNSELRRFVMSAWSPQRASAQSDSLDRMRQRLSELKRRL